MKRPNSFPKSEHLCGEIAVSRLFTKGDAFIAYPMRVVYLIEENNGNETVRVLVNVPKKRFKRAVKRNRLKRLMRESYRLNKQSLTEKAESLGLSVQVAFNYIADEELAFAAIEKKMKQALQKIADKTELPTKESSL